MKLAILLILFPLISGTIKPYNITILQLFPFGVTSPTYGGSCKAVSDLVINLYNNRSDLLPDYHVIAQSEDEDFGLSAPEHVARFVRSFEENANNELLRSPIILGGSYGVQRTAQLMASLHSIQICLLCTTPTLASHDRYPNLWMSLGSGDLFAMAVIKFVSQIGQWHRMAVITSPMDEYEFTTALAIQKLAMESGVAVPIFNIRLDFDDDAVLPMLETDIRIVMIMTTQQTDFFNFLCAAHRNRMTGDKFVFITDKYAYVSPELLTEQDSMCGRDVILEQYQYVFLIAYDTAIADGNARSELGYNSVEVESMVDQILHQRSLTQTADYEWKMICHDLALRGLNTLDEADKILKRKGMSLRDYTIMPQVVLQAINETLTSNSIRGLRIGEMKYSPRGQVDDEPLYVVHAGKNLLPRKLFVQRRHHNSTDFAVRSFYLTALTHFDWPAWRGAIPRDRMLKLTVVDGISESLFVAMVFMASNIFAIDLAVGSLVAFKKIAAHSPFSKVLGFVACSTLSVSCIILSIDAANHPSSIVIARIVLLTFGASLLNGVVTMRAIAHSKIIKPQLTTARSSHMRLRVVNPVTKGHEINSNDANKIDLITIYGTAIFTGLNIVIVTVWLAIDGFQCALEYVGSFYHIESDTRVEKVLMNCTTSNQSAWVISIALLHLIFEAIGAALFYRMKKRRSPIIGLDLTVPVCLINCIAVLVAIVLIAATLRTTISRNIAISFASLFLSGASTLAWIYPLIRDLRQLAARFISRRAGS